MQYLYVNECDLAEAEHTCRKSNLGEDLRDWDKTQWCWRRAKGKQAHGWPWPGSGNQSWDDYRFWKQRWTLRQRLLWIWSLAMRTLQGREKQILGPPSMSGPVWAVFHFNALCVYKGERVDEFSFAALWACVCVLDSANSDLHFPWTASEMFSDMGSVTAIIYKACSPLLPPTSFFHTHTYTHTHTADSVREWGWGSAAVITDCVTKMEIHT